jgi:hypothetical protein
VQSASSGQQIVGKDQRVASTAPGAQHERNQLVVA